MSYAQLTYRQLGVTALAATALLLEAAAPVSATPGTDVQGRELTRSSVGGRDFVVRDITIAPGGSTGWHWHDGTVTGVVKQGTLTHYDASCAVDGVYSAGDLIAEPSGPDHVHVGRNVGTEPVILEVLYADPIGKPLAEDASDPGCPFS